MKKLIVKFLIISSLMITLGACTQKFYAGRELPNVYLGELNWDIMQTRHGVFLSVKKIDNQEVYFISKAFLKPGRHLIEYTCQNTVWTDPYPDTTIVTVEANTRYGMVFSGFRGSSYPHPHPECNVNPPNNACFHQELVLMKMPLPCTYKLVAKENERPEFTDPLSTNPYITRDRHRLLFDGAKNCSAKDPRVCAYFGLPPN